MPDFKASDFSPGLNIAVAIRTKRGNSKDSRNAVGKSSLVAVLDFLLGSDVGTSHLLRRPELMNESFRLVFDGPTGPVAASRSGGAPGQILVDQNITNENEPIFSLETENTVSLTEWRSWLGAELFDVHGQPGEPSYRSLIAYYLRSARNGFGDPVKTVHQQSAADVQGPISYLFGFDHQLAQRAKDLAQARKNVSALRKLSRDPVLGRTFGDAGQLEAEIATLTIQRDRIAQQLAEFRVLDRYNEHRQRADQLSQRIRRANDQAAIVEQRSRELTEAVRAEDDSQPDHNYLREAYEQVNITFPDAVRRRFGEVEEFHRSVVRNRRQYLTAELTQTEQRAIDLQEEIRILDSERSGLMKLLQQGGALETFQEIQRQLGELDGRIAGLRERRTTLVRLREAENEIKRDSLQLHDQVEQDLAERRDQINMASQLFTRYAFELYESHRSAALIVEAAENGYRITPTLGSDRSTGVKHMAIFCFDLAMVVSAHRAGRGPDFLVHDSQLYDGVEERQLAYALDLANKVCEEEGLQYVVTLNSDDLEKAERIKPGLSFHQCTTMTDEYDTGGLFGIRFH